MNTPTIVAAITAGAPSLRDIALILEALEHALKRHGAEGFDALFYVEHGRLEAEYAARVSA